MQIKCIHCENGIRKNPNLRYMHVLKNGECVPCPFETREYRRGLMKAHLTKYAPDVASATSAEPLSGLESVPAVESDTQPRG